MLSGFWIGVVAVRVLRGYDVASLGNWFLTLWGDKVIYLRRSTCSKFFLGHFEPQRWDHYIALKFWETITQWCGVTSQKNRNPN